MAIQKTHERMETVNRHITTKARGNIDVLAHKLGLHTAGAYKFLDEMRNEGFPIAYSKKENRFYYSEKGKMVGYTFVRETDEEEPDDENSGGGGRIKNFKNIFNLHL